MEINFEYCAKIVLNIEGGLSLNPNDKGNWTGGKIGVGKLKGTKHGISAAAYPNEDIAAMTPERALMLFEVNYWDKFRCNQIPNALRLHYFDVCINSYGPRAIKLLQRAAGFSGKGVDGVLGPKTLTAAQRVTVWEYARERTDFYVIIALGDESQHGFLAGWIGRVLEITEKSL